MLKHRNVYYDDKRVKERDEAREEKGNTKKNKMKVSVYKEWKNEK